MSAPVAAPAPALAPTPRVSVVVAFHGRREKTLACLESLLAQEIRDAEFILVDDGSPDDTADAVAAHIALRGDPRARVLRNGRNLGANATRNHGVSAARAPLIAFLDSDCTAEDGWLEALVAPFADPSVGAVSGLVEDSAQSNPWELAFRGTHRLPRRGPVSRMVIGNLCVRRTLLGTGLDESRPTRLDPRTGRPDLSISARSDEEGLNLAIRAAGWKVLAEPSARAIHHHPYTRRSLLRQAYFGGQSAAEIVWRYRLGPRRDLGPIAATYALLVAALAALPFLGPTALLAPAAAALLPVAAISYNELANKGKSPPELLRAAPALFVYYHARLAGYLLRRAQLALGVRRITRVDPRDLARTLPTPEVA